MRTPHPPALSENPVRLILILALAPAIGMGLCRFGYSLVLPDMRDSLGWSYSAAGFMNTMNAAGYLAGALGASAVIRRYGLFGAISIGTVACLISLVMSTLSGNFVVFSTARLLSGIGAAVAFVGGGALAATIAQANPSRSAVLHGLFYIGPSFGIVISGLAAPFLLQANGPGSWWIVWGVLAVIAAAMTSLMLLNRIDTPIATDQNGAGRTAITPILIFLIGYFCFGAGYIAYMTFMIAFVRDSGGGALAQSAFWCTLGISSFGTPWIWRGLIARGDTGASTALLITITAVGAALPLFGQSTALLAASAMVFGLAFFPVVSATTAFVRHNYPAAEWSRAIALLTIVFSIGQTIGPFVTGAITDATGSLSYALIVSAAMLVIGAIATACQPSLHRTART